MAIECGVWVRMGTEGLRARQEHSPPDLGWFCFDSLKKAVRSGNMKYCSFHFSHPQQLSGPRALATFFPC